MNALDRVQVAKTVRTFLDTKRPVDPAIRVELDFAFRFHRQSVELLEIRPKFNKPGKTDHAFAKATFVKAQAIWKVYWMRGNLKWHPYQLAKVRSLNAFLKLVGEDKHHCFFG